MRQRLCSYVAGPFSFSSSEIKKIPCSCLCYHYTSTLGKEFYRTIPNLGRMWLSRATVWFVYYRHAEGGLVMPTPLTNSNIERAQYS